MVDGNEALNTLEVFVGLEGNGEETVALFWVMKIMVIDMFLPICRMVI